MLNRKGEKTRSNAKIFLANLCVLALPTAGVKSLVFEQCKYSSQFFLELLSVDNKIKKAMLQ